MWKGKIFFKKKQQLYRFNKPLFVRLCKPTGFLGAQFQAYTHYLNQNRDAKKW